MSAVVSLAQALGSNPLNESRSSVIIIPLDVNDHIRRDDVRSFQYFPSSVTSQRAINWQAKDVPGASLPIYQWISSGANTVSFTAVFTSDVDLLSQSNLSTRLKQVGQQDRNVDIRSAKAWLRQFMVPSYGQQSSLGSPTTFAPAKFYLYMQNSGIGMEAGASPFGNNDCIPCIMTQCDFETTSYFPSGLPRVMTAQLAFAQIAQMNGVIGFPAGPLSTPVGGSVGGLMEQYITGPGDFTTQAAPLGSAIPGQMPPQDLPFGYRVQPKLSPVYQAIAGSSFT